MNKTSTQQSVQRFGRFLSSMVMPNIGAFIAWGFLTALFIGTGWLPNESFATIVDPMLKYLLPILVAYTGGKIVGDVRGGIIAAIAVIGVIQGAEIPMILGAMIMGPFAGLVIKKFDKLINGKIPTGFEMLVNNFSLGIIGLILLLLGYVLIGPAVSLVTGILATGADIIYNAGLLPLISIFVEPAKILFLNNAINHGIFGPIGLEQVAASGKSIMFLIESNPGPGLGVLLAYWLFGKGTAKQSAPGAVIIHFLGGIHEIYFPYVLMNPLLLISVIAGGSAGVFTFVITGAGLYATPSPGSIFALAAMSPKDGLIPVLAGVLVATIVSFAISMVIVKRSGDVSDEALEKATEQSKQNKNLSKEETNRYETIKKEGLIIFACDAGMGSSAMGATVLKKMLEKAGVEITVKNSAIDVIPMEATIVITQSTLTDRAKSRIPNARHISIKNFMNAPEYDMLVEELSKGSL